MMTRWTLRTFAGRFADALSTGTWPFALAVVIPNVVVGFAEGFTLSSVVLLVVTVGLAALLCFDYRGRPPEALRRSRSAVTPSPEELVTQSLNFIEDLELTVRVGADPEGDHVVEHRSTRPDGLLGYRQLTLISPYADSGADEASAVPVLSVDSGDVDATWHPVSIPGRGAVVFTPALDHALSWRLAYDMPGGIWNPLRSIGVDFLRYDVRDFPIARFVVRFIVHAGAESAFVQERNGRGRTTGFARNRDGELVAEWTADDPAPQAQYEWDLRVDWHTEHVNSPRSTSGPGARKTDEKRAGFNPGMRHQGIHAV